MILYLFPEMTILMAQIQENVLANFVELENLLSCVPGPFTELFLSYLPPFGVTLLSGGCWGVAYHQDQFRQRHSASSVHPTCCHRTGNAPCRWPKRATQRWLAKKPGSGKRKHVEILGQLADGRQGVRQDISYESTTTRLSIWHVCT